MAARRWLMPLVLVFVLAGTAAPVFPPSEYLTGSVKYKRKPGAYSPMTIKFTCIAFAPGALDFDPATEVAGFIFDDNVSGYSTGFGSGDKGAKCRNGRCSFKSQSLKVKGDAATGLFSVKLRWEILDRDPEPPFMFRFLLGDQQSTVSDDWTPHPKKPGCFVYP